MLPGISFTSWISTATRSTAQKTGTNPPSPSTPPSLAGRWADALLRVTQFISIKSASSIPAVRRLFTAGILLFLFVLPVLYLILYIHYMRPIMRMQGDIRQAYKAGIKPKRTARKDEIGQLQNAFVQLTEDLEMRKGKAKPDHSFYLS